MNEYNVINTSQKKSDWNASEGEAGFIKNRTHYEAITKIEPTHTFEMPDGLSEEVYIENSSINNDFIQYLVNEFDIFNAADTQTPVLLDTGKVKINGTVYDCYWYLMNKTTSPTSPMSFGLNCSAIENPDPNNPLSDGFFFIYFYRGQLQIIYDVNSFNVGQNEIAISKIGQKDAGIEQTEIKKIDIKFLPDMGGGLNNAKDAENGGIIEGLVNGNEGEINVASGAYSHAEGGNVFTEDYGEAQYVPNIASGIASHAEGAGTTASGWYAHAEGGQGTNASGDYSHAEGAGTTASGGASHAEGSYTTASGNCSHAEGQYSTASGLESHAEGAQTTASGNYSHAEGGNTNASGAYSHAEGSYTTANHFAQHVFGQYNIADPSTESASAFGTYVEIVGNGTAYNKLSNARTLDWNGNEWLKGSVTADGGLILKSPDGSSFTIRVANDGSLSAVKNV